MTRSERLRPVQDFAESKVQKAVSELVMRRAELQRQKERLQQLVDYRDEYGRDFRLHGESSRDPAWMRNYQLFISQLNDGIETQQQVILDSQLRLEQAQEVWEELSRHASALDHAVERLVDKEKRLQATREQLVLDEQAQLRWRRS